ncbi:MAG: hypothetical protein PVTTEEND_002193 [Candidatus Fervidibacter sp.]
MAWCCIELFGGLRVWVNGRLITRFRTRKTAALLAYLAYHLDRLHHRNALTGMFWGDRDPEQGRNSLSKALSSLRQQLMPPAGGQGGILYADRFYVGLRSEHVTTDVAEFEAHLNAARSARSDAERVAHLANAVRLYRGELLPDFDEAWIEPERARRAEQFAHAVQALVSLHERMGDWEQAIHYARLAVAVDPLSEVACERLMRLFLALQRPTEALQAFEEFRRRLTDAFGRDAQCFSPHLPALAQEAQHQLAQLFASHPPEMTTSLVTPSFAPFPLGTVTLLAVAWHARFNGQTNFPERLKGIVQQHRGQTLKVGKHSLLALFPCAQWAAECAVACHHLSPERAVRGVLDTVDLTDDTKLRDALQHMEQLLATVGEGNWLCSETTAMVLERLRRLAAGEGHSTRWALLDDFVVIGERAMAPNLPPSVNGFFGRTSELEELRRQFLQEGAALVTLVGLGGCGKTRLALEFGRQMSDAYQNAVWFVPLQDVTNPAALGEALARALGLSKSADERSPIGRAFRALAGRRCLLIWDGFEQVLPDGAQSLRAILERLPTAQHLVTSRCPLGLPQEQVMPLLPLPAPSLPDDEAALIDLDALKAYPSVQMFLDRAQRVRPDFQLTERMARKVAAICARLEGIPLAVEIAAAQLASLSLSQIEEGLKRRLDFLHLHRRDIPQRHRSLRAVLTMTWELLPPKLRDCLAGMSVFRGGATADAVSAITEMPDAADALRQLQRWGLIQSEENADGNRRFHLLDIVREFVTKQLSLEEVAILRRRHAAFFAAWAERFGDGVGRTATDWAQWLREIEAEGDNLRAALKWAIEHDLPTALRLLRALSPFWRLQGAWQEAYAWAQQLQRRAADANPTVEAESCLLAARWALSVGDIAEAKALSERASAFFEGTRDFRKRAETHLLLAHIAAALGNVAIAKRHALKSLAYCRTSGDLLGEADAEWTLALLAFRQGDLNRSHRHYTQSLQLCEAKGDFLRAAKAKEGLAAIAWRQGDYAKARSLYKEAAAFWRRLSPSKLAGFLTDLGLLALFMGDYEQARRHYEAALSVRRSWGDQEGVGAALNGLASVAWRQGRLDDAEHLLTEALAIFQALGNRWCFALTLTDLGNVALLKGNPERAEALLAQSLKLWRTVGDRWGIANTLRKLGETAIRKGQWGKALTWLKEGLQLADAIGDKVGIIEGAEALAEIAMHWGNHHLAAQLLATAAALRQQIKVPLSQVKKERHATLLSALQKALGVRLDSLREGSQLAPHRIRTLVAQTLALCRRPNGALKSVAPSQWRSEQA